MLVKEIFCDCGRVLKLVLWGGCGVFVKMNVGLAGGLSFSFVLSWFYCVWAWLCFLVFEGFSMFHVKHDVFTTTHLFHVKRCFCFTTSQGCQCVSRETLVLNLIQLLGNAVQRLKALTCMTTF